ncbi:hypothetical protein ACUXIC_001852 [Enterococcus lactis]
MPFYFSNLILQFAHQENKKVNIINEISVKRMNPKKKVLKDLSFHNFFMYSIFHFYTKNNIYMHLVYIIIKNNL